MTKKKVRQPHEMICRCKSVNVIVDITRSYEYASDDGDRVVVRKRRLRCRKCGHKWWRRVRIKETIL